MKKEVNYLVIIKISIMKACDFHGTEYDAMYCSGNAAKGKRVRKQHDH